MKKNLFNTIECAQDELVKVEHLIPASTFDLIVNALYYANIMRISLEKIQNSDKSSIQSRLDVTTTLNKLNEGVYAIK